MKEYKSNEELIKYLISKNVVVKNEQDGFLSKNLTEIQYY